LLLAATSAAIADQPRGRAPAPVSFSPRFEVVEQTIPELQEAMRAGKVTSRQLVEIYLSRIEAYDRRGPRLNAMVALNPRALDLADALDRERAEKGPRGPLHGIPIVVKDNFETSDMPTAAGSLALASFHPASDAFQVRRLREAGAVIVGKTNMHELASGITTISSVAGQTRNPYDLARNPGGSSGGTGAAVAASFAAAGMGSDTCGSIRIPASHNNLVGLRGTRGLASSRGIVPLSRTQDIGGPLARTLMDLALMLDATVGPDPEDPATSAAAGRLPGSYVEGLQGGALKGARLGVLTSLFGAASEDGEVGGIVRKAIDRMKSEGAEAIDVTVPGLDDLLRGGSVIDAEFKFDLADYLTRHPDAPVRSLAEILKLGLYDSSMESPLNRRNNVEKQDTDEYRRALVKRDALRNAVVATMEEHRLAALVYPTLRRKPARLGEPQAGTNCSLSANSGLPALSVPAGFTDDGLPIGVEFLGREFSEAELLKIAYGWEQAAKLRQAPFSTPPLVEGKAPGSVSFEARSGAAEADTRAAQRGAALRARLTYDPVTAELRYDVRVTGVAPEDLRLVALHRGDGDQPGGVLARLIEPGTAGGTGSLTLGYRDRDNLRAGRLFLQVYTRQQPLGTLRARVALPAGSRPVSGANRLEY
jgi:Asp-tRNA(Asn)/Glu-tRNA(Gln) amidotransferase A subunit family amidase